MMDIRSATLKDADHICLLYKQIAKNNPGNINQDEDQITLSYAQDMILNGLSRGIVLVLFKDGQFIGYIKGYTSQFRISAHVMANVTIMISPKFQKNQYGFLLLQEFQARIQSKYRHIMKVELLPHQKNVKAIQMYHQKFGYNIQYKSKNKIRNSNGTFEEEVLMDWYNPKFDEKELQKYHKYLKGILFKGINQQQLHPKL